MFDIIRLLPISNDDIRLKIFKLQAEIICHEIQMSTDEIQEYHVSFNNKFYFKILKIISDREF